MKYDWKDGAIWRNRADVQKVAEEIEQCQTKTPENIVERAKDENSAMHDLFEWDDAIAGQKYRECQARDIIRSIVIVPEEKEEETEKPWF